MRIRASERTEKEWVKKHLNNGLCPADKQEWSSLLRHMVGWEDIACLDALDWLSKAEVYSMEDAWRLCPRADWLVWIVMQMKPSKADLRLCSRSVLESMRLLQCDPNVDQKKAARALYDSWWTTEIKGFMSDMRKVLKQKNITQQATKNAVGECLYTYSDFVNIIDMDYLFRGPHRETHTKEFFARCADTTRELFKKNPWKY
jgi:hypothetical protein